MQTHFFNHVAMDIGTKKCKDCTAPGISESHPVTEAPANENGKRTIAAAEAGTLSKNQLDKIDQEAQVREELEALTLKLKQAGEIGKWR